MLIQPKCNHRNPRELEGKEPTEMRDSLPHGKLESRMESRVMEGRGKDRERAARKRRLEKDPIFILAKEKIFGELDAALAGY
jgi:hypothetical protein